MKRTIGIGRWICGILLAVTPSISEPVRAAAELCGVTVLEDLRLDDDLTCSGDGLVAGADGIKINLNGHTITGSGTGAGIVVAGRSDVSISGGTLRNFETGIRISASSDVIVKDMLLSENTDGVDCQAGCHAATVKASALIGNRARGIMVRAGTSGLTVKANTFVGNRVGVLLFATVDAIVKDNLLTGSLLAAIRVNTPSTRNVVLANSITANPAGIEFLVVAGLAATGNSLFENTFELNTCGVKGPIAGNTLSGNLFLNNSADSCGV